MLYKRQDALSLSMVNVSPQLRRGVSILQCHFTTPDELEKRYEHEVWEWEPARVVFVPYQ